MPIDAKSKPDDYQHRVLFLRLGEAVASFYRAKYPDPFERRTAKPVNEAKLLASITDQTNKLKGLIAEYSTFALLRKSCGVQAAVRLKDEVIQLVALVAYFDCIKGEQPVEVIGNHLGPILDADHLEGILSARKTLASLLERGTLVIQESLLHVGPTLSGWLSGGHPLCVPHLSETSVRYYLQRKSAKAEPAQKPAPTFPNTIKSPYDLYQRLKQYVHGQDDACKVLATRGWLHYKRAELMRVGQNVGTNECLFFISQQSGVGKTYLAETYGKLCSLPFASFSSTDATAVGFVGLDLVEDSIKALIRAAGSPQEPSSIQKAQQGGIIFYDEFTKKRNSSTTDGKDITGVSVQHEILRVMEGCRVQLGNRRMERDANPVEVETSGMMFLFGGYVDGFDSIIAKLNRKGGLGFGGSPGDTKLRDAYLYDALLDYGMAREFLNRLTKIVMFRKLTPQDLVAIANGSAGVVANYNRLLCHQGLAIKVDTQGLQCMAELSVETGMMARGLRMIVGALVEDAVFSEAKGEVTFGLGEVKRAIERVGSVDGTGAAPGAALS